MAEEWVAGGLSGAGVTTAIVGAIAWWRQRVASIDAKAAADASRAAEKAAADAARAAASELQGLRDHTTRVEHAGDILRMEVATLRDALQQLRSEAVTTLSAIEALLARSSR